MFDSPFFEKGNSLIKKVLANRLYNILVPFFQINADETARHS